MSLNQQLPASRGQAFDTRRGTDRSRFWPGFNVVWTATVGGTYANGVYSFLNNGTLVSVTAAASSNAGVAADLKVEHDSIEATFSLAEGTVAGAVLTLEARSPDIAFSLTTPVAPGGATLVLNDATTTVNPTRLRPGLFVALSDTDAGSLRRLKTGDTAARIFGVTMENPEMASNAGVAADVDGWDQGAMVTVRTVGEIPVPVEQAVTDLNVGVYARIIAPGTEEVGAARLDVDGGNAILVTNARWSSLSYLDALGQLTADVIVNMP